MSGPSNSLSNRGRCVKWPAISTSRVSPRKRSRIQSGRIVGLKIACRREIRERVARAPERFRGLPGAQLPAVPHDIGTHATPGGGGRQPLDGRAARFRERATRIDIGSDRVAVMDENEPHGVDFEPFSAWSRFALNSLPGFHSGIFSACAMRYPTAKYTFKSSRMPLRSQSGLTTSAGLW